MEAKIFFNGAAIFVLFCLFFRWNEGLCTPMDRTGIDIFVDTLRRFIAHICAVRDSSRHIASFLAGRRCHWRKLLLPPSNIPLHCLLGNQEVVMISVMLGVWIQDLINWIDPLGTHGTGLTVLVSFWPDGWMPWSWSCKSLSALLRDRNGIWVEITFVYNL